MGSRRLVAGLLVTAAAAVVANTPHNLTLLSPTAEARCLDGSPAGYYWRAGKGQDADNWILHFQGGGWCFNETYCEQRSTTSLGSSKAWPPTSIVPYTVFQDDCSLNPVFCNFSTVILKYCDGASHVGYRADTVLGPKGTKMFMRGAANRDGILDDLAQRHGLHAARQVLVSGCSAGGLASILNADRVAQRLPDATVSAMPDAGFFVDARTVGGVWYQRELFKYIATMQNTSGGVDTDCIAQYRREDPSGSSDWHCLFAQYTLPHVETPVFLLQSQYDTYQLQNGFAPPWLPSTPPHWGDCQEDPTECTPEMKHELNVNWRGQILGALNASGALSGGRSGKGGIFAHSCWMHCQDGPPQWENLTIHGTAMGQAVDGWYTSLAAEAVLDGAGADGNIYVDGPWPSNPSCPTP